LKNSDPEAVGVSDQYGQRVGFINRSFPRSYRSNILK
jgi:hypothetical protein